MERNRAMVTWALVGATAAVVVLAAARWWISRGQRRRGIASPSEAFAENDRARAALKALAVADARVEGALDARRRAFEDLIGLGDVGERRAPRDDHRETVRGLEAVTAGYTSERARLAADTPPAAQ